MRRLRPLAPASMPPRAPPTCLPLPGSLLAPCPSPLQDLGDEELLLWYCAACEKHFKSEPAFANHERSKKHLQQASCCRGGRRGCTARWLDGV